MKNCSYFHEKNLNLFILVFIAGSLAFALTAELFYHIKPCHLCLYLRGLYWVILATSLFLVRFSGWMWLRILRLLLLIGAMALSFYHLGVEQKWWSEPSACHHSLAYSSVDDKELTVQQKISLLRHSIQADSSRPRCSQVNWRLFGFSATLWNTLALSMVVMISLGISIGARPCAAKI